MNSTRAWLEETYDHYGGASYSLAVRILGLGEDAEDAVVEAFQELSRLQRGNQHADVRALILLVTRNAAVARLRRRKGLPVHESVPLYVGFTFSAAAGLQSADEHAQTGAALAALEPTMRLVLERAFFEGHTPAEIAADLGVTDVDVNHALVAAMRALSARWSPRKDTGAPPPRFAGATAADASARLPTDPTVNVVNQELPARRLPFTLSSEPP